ncbi:unnamed protein product [Paramecium sonneborni]|uniref:PA14 domain-containing protein n=1 Tax=Paramecium sonneborni TaxID=65129 RepID=A0A8S1RIW1_9CILI|nr:unnamed protein product [Paramecium sonneborni]
MLSCLLLKCLLVHQCVLQLKGCLQIQLYWVSTNPLMEIENLYGSTQGGTSLYLRAVGFDSIISNNIIQVGTYSCIIDETYVKDQELSCKTIAPALNDNQLQNLVVTVEVPGQQISVCTSQKNKCLFSYIKEKSPYLHYLIPNIGFANSVLFSKGSWTIIGEENNEIEKILIGQEFCRKSQYRLLNSRMISNEDVISCQLPENLISQTYQVKMETRRGNFLQQKAFKLLPIISSLSEKEEMVDSYHLKINGYGFKSGLTENQVQLSGTNVLIKVLEAQINQLKVEIPKVTDQTILDILSNQDSVFISGTGLFHTKYDLRGITTQYSNCDIFRNEIIQESQILKDRIIQNGVYSQPDYIDEIDSQYGQYFRGFIKATATGEYQFLLAADDCATFYIQTTETLKTTRTESPNAQSFKSTQYRNYWGEQLWDNTKNVNSISQTIILEENQYYYIEIFHLNTEGKGFLTLSMNLNINQVSTTNTKQSQLFQVKTTYTPKYEILQMDIYNSIENMLLSENFKLTFQGVNQDINNFSFITQDISFSFTYDQIQEAFLTCCNYITQVQINKLDNLGQVVDDSFETYAGHQYIITFLSHRGNVEERSLPEIITQQSQLIFNVQTIQEPLDPISGFFKLSLQYQSKVYNFVNENNSSELSYNVDSNILEQNFYKITGQKPIVWNEGRAQDGWIWNILFSTCQITIQSFQQIENNLVSGNGNVQLDVSNLKSCNSQFYEPIPALQLFTFGRRPQIQVSTSEGQGACQQQGVCDFSFQEDDQFMLQSFTISNEIMQLNFIILSQNLLNLNANEFTIEFRGALCLDISKISSDISVLKLTCKLETQNSKVVQESGLNQYPIIYHVIYGYIKIDTKIAAINTYILIESVTPNSGSPDGGAEIVILGSGFPKDLSRKFQLQMGSTKIIPLEISNTKIVFIHPSGNDGKITIEYNGITQNDLSFIYDETLKISISSLDIYQIIPTYRGVVKITGKNFGTVVEDVKAFIQNQELKVINVQDQLMSVQFNKNLDISSNNVIQVYRRNYGRSTSIGTSNVNIMNIALNVTSVGTVVDGYVQTLIEGGTNLQITGTNLDSVSAVVFGKDNPTVCTRMNKNQTYINCRSPPNIFKRQTDQIYVIHEFKYQTTCSKCIVKYSRTYIQITQILIGSGNIIVNNLEYKIRYLQLWSEEAKSQENNPLLYYKQVQQMDPLLFYEIKNITTLDFNPGQALVILASLNCKLNFFQIYNLLKVVQQLQKEKGNQ